MRKLVLLFLIGIVAVLQSCRKDFAFEPSTGGLEFSKNTVFLDTVFTNIGSSTYRLKVYNRSNKDIAIPSIQLGKGMNSKFRIMVDGRSGNGKIFENVELLAKDSLFIFIETTASITDANPTDFLYTDQIEFTNVAGSPQKVDLVTLVKDAYFIYPNRTTTANNAFVYENINLGVDDANQNVTLTGSNLDENDPVNGDEFNWSNSKPYVVYGYALVPDGKTLHVQAGARVYFHANSGIIVAKNGRLFIDGQPPTSNDPSHLLNEVVFQGDRLEPEFAAVPGQWGAIINFSTRNDNEIHHLTLKNAAVGILSYNLALTTDTSVTQFKIVDSQIYNCSNVGILARGAKIEGENLVINNCGEATLACTLGGSYKFTHCTFNNNWNSSSQVAVLLSNYIETIDSIIVGDLSQADFTNCIIYGGNQVEMLLQKRPEKALNYKFDHCMIKFNNNQLNGNGLYNFNDTSLYNQCYIATSSTVYNPKFKNVNENKLWPTQDIKSSQLVEAIPTSVTTDILNKSRTTVSNTIGAYQFITD